MIQLTREFEEKFKGLNNKNLEESRATDLNDLKKQVSRITDQVNNMSKKSSKPGGRKIDTSKPMTNAEKNDITKRIHLLSPQSKRGILTIIKSKYPTKNGVVEIDINKLPPETCYELDKYAREALAK